jgi:hypothetical protein
VNPYLRELVGVSGLERLWDWRIYVDVPNLPAALPFLDALNVRFYFDLKSVNPILAQNLKLLHRADLDVYESPTAWPRAFFTDRVEVYDEPAQFVERIRAAHGQPFAAVQRSDASAQAALTGISSDSSSRTVSPATNYQLTENTTSFTVHATGPGAIVLTEAFWPGDFRAEVNGRKAPVIRLNHAFKGVVVPGAGEYHVTFRYWPKNFDRYLGMCGLGAVLLAGSLFWGTRSSRWSELKTAERSAVLA